MKIQPLLIQNYSYKFNCTTAPSFNGKMPIETIKHYNLGIMSNGIVGKVRVAKASGEEVFLNVVKQATAFGEIYSLMDDMSRIIGKIEFKLKKIDTFDYWQQQEDSSHVFIEKLRNFSRPKTPYHVKNLEEYKQVGVRLLQIAQRRSDECNFNGNIELISKEESMPFYEKLGFKRAPFVSKYINPNKIYLPPEAKEELSKMYGGL